MWDGDPVSLHPHIPVESAKRYVDLIGAEKILAGRQAGLRRRRLPVGRRDLAQARLRPARQPGREGPAGRRVRADGLPDRGAAMARHLPDRRPRAARRRPRGVVQHRLTGHARWRCRWTCCSTSPACTSSATRPSTPICGSTSPSPTSTRPGPSGSNAACSTPALGASPDTQLAVSGSGRSRPTSRPDPRPMPHTHRTTRARWGSGVSARSRLTSRRTPGSRAGRRHRPTGGAPRAARTLQVLVVEVEASSGRQPDAQATRRVRPSEGGFDQGRGAPRGNRTPNPLIKSQLLCLLS